MWNCRTGFTKEETAATWPIPSLNCAATTTPAANCTGPSSVYNLYGHAAQPWITWNNLHRLEQATGHPEAAAQARQQAIQCFLAYRRDGGEKHDTGAQHCALVAQAIGQGETAQAAAVLAQYANHPDAKVLIAKLQAILNGDRNPALADDPALNYDDAVELQLLLEGVA